VLSIWALGADAQAREGAAGGVFFDLPGALSDSGVLPMTRLVLGDGFAVSQLDLLFGLPTGAIPNPGVRFLPYFVLNFPIHFNEVAVLTPYAGVAPVLFTSSALAAPPLADWVFKFGTSFTFSGFGFFAETGFFVPIAALPSFAVGFAVDFRSLDTLFCDTCVGESYY
jgi:hypothetical protein